MTFSKNPPAASQVGGVWERQIRSCRNILSSILQNHGTSLNDESLQRIVTEVQVIVNSRPLTIETLSDPTSPMPISLANLLTLKTKLIMPPLGSFDQPDMYSRRRWRRIQHLGNKFCTRLKNEFLSTLQSQQNWNHLKDNIEVGDVILSKTNNVNYNKWPIARVVEKMPDKDGLVRTVKLRIAIKNNSDQTLIRTITRLLLLVRNEDVQFFER